MAQHITHAPLAMPQIIGDRGLDNGVLEYKCRRSGEKQEVAVDDIVALLKGKPGR